MRMEEVLFVLVNAVTGEIVGHATEPTT
jgi:hypothetical protein